MNNEKMIEQVEGMRQQMETLRQQMSEDEQKMAEQNHVIMLAKMDQTLSGARARISRRDSLQKESREYNDAHSGERPLP